MRRTRYFKGEMTVGRAYTYVKQHRLNTRQRNSVLKLRVATNCPDWDTKLEIIKAYARDHCRQRIWPRQAALADPRRPRGRDRHARARKSAPPSRCSRRGFAGALGSGVMSQTHWLEGIVANTCAERANVPGYGEGMLRERGWCGFSAIATTSSSDCATTRWNSSSCIRRRISSIRNGLARCRQICRGIPDGRSGGERLPP